MSGRLAAVVIGLIVITGIVVGPGGQSTRAEGATPAACPATTPPQNATLVRHYWEEVYNGHDPQRVAAFLADDYVRHDPGVPEEPQAGLADDIARTTAQLAEFPDLHVSIDDLITDGDQVVVRLTWRGTQLAPLAPWGAPATGRPAEFASVSIVRIACGRFVEEWALFDDLTMMRQLGIISDEELTTAVSPGSASPTVTETPAPGATPVAGLPVTSAQTPSGRPRVFIASSVEALPIAEAIAVDLQYVADVTIWDERVYHLSTSTLAGLDAEADQADFAIAVLTADDTTTRRGRSYSVARDNVIFELGFFMGRLGTNRTFMVYSRDTSPVLPSDLQGVTAATFAERADGNLEAALGPVATQIREEMQAVIAAEGVRPNGG